MHKKILMFSIFVFACMVLLSLPARAEDLSGADQAQKQMVMQNLSNMPLSFTENQGQWDERVLFQANAGGATMWFTKEGVYYQFSRRIPKGARPLNDPMNRLPDRIADEPDSIEQLFIKSTFVGANRNPIVHGEEAMEYKCNYFIGNDQTKWRTDVPNYKVIVFKDIYTGIDLKYHGDGKRMEYDFIVSPGSDYSQIRVQYDGAKSLSVNDSGELVVESEWGGLKELRPKVYQDIDGQRTLIKGKYLILSGNTFAFKLCGDYNPAYAIAIDPVVLSYSTFLGGGNSDEGSSIAVDDSRCVYVTGRTHSADFPTVNPYDGSYNGDYDAFITKFNSAGNGLVYSTYLGGTGLDTGGGIVVDSSDYVYVLGATRSSDFPTANPYDGSQNGGSDAFIAKLNSAGNGLVYSTYLGGSADDGWAQIAVDNLGHVYVSGMTRSSDFPTVNPYDGSYNGSEDVFVTKFNSAGNGLVYSTYLGGSGRDWGIHMAVDDSGCVYVTGWTDSTDFPTVNPYDGSYNGSEDVFVTKFNSTGDGLIYSTYLGGSYKDNAEGIAVDDSGCVYVSGWTHSADFPTVNPYDGSYNGSWDAFVTKFNSAGNGLVYSTYLGGTDIENGRQIAVDSSGHAYVTGHTYSPDFPTVSPYDGSYNGSADVFVTKFNSTGNGLIYSTYLGGSGEDDALGIAVDNSGLAYVTGFTTSSNFPTINAYDSTQDGYSDVFMAIISDSGSGQLFAGWRFSIRTGSCEGGLDVSLWARHESSSQLDLLWSRDCDFPHDTICTGEGIIPHWADQLIVREVGCCYSCIPAVFEIVAASRVNDIWKINNLGVWIDLHIGKGELEVPFVIDTLPGLDTIYSVVNLETWITDPLPPQDTYNIVDGTCPELPGFLFGTTPIVFDSMAGPDQNPFSTTPLTGTLYLKGETGVISNFAVLGDANGDGQVNLADAVYLVNYLFIGGPPPEPLEAGDANCDGEVNLADAVYIINYLFIGGPPPCS
jgi:hypothetical protein